MTGLVIAMRGEGGDGDAPLTRVAGLTVIERALLSARAAGVTDFVLVLGPLTGRVAALLASTPGLRRDVTITYADEVGDAPGADPVVLLEADRFFDPRILAGMLAADMRGSLMVAVDHDAAPAGTRVREEGGTVLAMGTDVAGANAVDIGAYRCTPGFLRDLRETGTIADAAALAVRRGDATAFDIGGIDAYATELRKTVPPWWAAVHDARDVARARKILIENASKGASDVIARYLHKPIENLIVLRIADLPITPNQLTVAVNVLAYLVTALFALGLYLPASILTFVVGVADGLDGKLARVTGRTSRLGSLEHSFDVLFEFSWLLALGGSVTFRTGDRVPLLLAGVAIVLIAFYRHVYDTFRKAAGRSLDDSGPFERVFRRVAGRRNLFNVPILLFVLLGVPGYALYAIAAWAALTALVYGWRAMVRLAAMDRRAVS